MARRKAAAAQEIVRPTYESATETLFWQRLDNLDRGGQLKGGVNAAIRNAEPLLDSIVRYMPLFTLHNKRHILNVVGWMECLLGQEGIDKLTAPECALCLLAAYVHDLGMTLSEAEYREILGESSTSELRQSYLRHRDGFLDERLQIQTLRNAGHNFQAGLLEHHILTDFLRATHADNKFERLKTRLAEVLDDKLDGAAGFPFHDVLGIIAASHNHDLASLRNQLKEKAGAHHTTGCQNQRVNYILPALLLRLADIMDFDASRTPSVLYRHIGLDVELGNRFQDVSRQEWHKHLAITGSPWKDKKLVYQANRCPHPAVEKSIREFVGLIDRELRSVRDEFASLFKEDNSLPELILPEEVKAEVVPERSNGRPIYTYHDWHFRLDDQEIIRLLMGESLYGDPSLCIRELLQNALDAVELRDLRLRYLTLTGEHLDQPVDGEPTEPGKFRYQGKEERLEVRLTWGEENGDLFIRVEDNGVGMTQDVIQRYFTRIGKSYYRSPDFEREQAALRRVGLFATPISQFGIGVLSCFMIADRISVRTHPGGVPNRPATDLEVSGPGSLFWTKPGTRTRQGTEITLWLRKELKGREVKLEHDWERCREALRRHFG